MMMNEWKFKVWMNDTALNYLNSFPHTDMWSLPLEEWIYHSVAESSLLFAAISDTVPEICGPLMQTEETENTFTIAVKSLKDQYVNKFPEFAKYRLASKMNDLLLIEDKLPEIIQNEPNIWKEAIEELADEISDSRILPNGVLIFNKTNSIMS